MSYYTAAQRNGESWAQPPSPYVSARPAYGANLYRDADTGRERWAVLHYESGTWHFPERYGMRAAQTLAQKLNKDTL